MTVRDSLIMSIKTLGAQKSTQLMAGFNNSVSKSTASIITMAGALTAAYATLRFMTKATTLALDQLIANAKLGNTIQTTGNKLNTTTQLLNAFANLLQRATGIDDTLISRLVISNLLTFKAITDKGIFLKATRLVLDMSKAMGTDLKSSAIQLGKALEDPKKMLGSLTRNGITFTDAQTLMITHFLETNQIAKAQGVILGLVGVAYDRLATKMASPIDIAMLLWNDTMLNLGYTILPNVIKVMKALNTLLVKFNDAQNAGVKGTDAITKAIDVGTIISYTGATYVAYKILGKLGGLILPQVSKGVKNIITGQVTQTKTTSVLITKLKGLGAILSKTMPIWVAYGAASTLPNFNKTLGNISNFNRLAKKTQLLGLNAPKGNFFKTMFGGLVKLSLFNTSISMMLRNILSINLFKKTISGITPKDKTAMMSLLNLEMMLTYDTIQTLNLMPESLSNTIAVKSMWGLFLVLNLKINLIKSSFNDIKAININKAISLVATKLILSSFDKYLLLINKAQIDTSSFLESLLPNKSTILKLDLALQNVGNDIAFIQASMEGYTGKLDLPLKMQLLIQLQKQLTDARNKLNASINAGLMDLSIALQMLNLRALGALLLLNYQQQLQRIVLKKALLDSRVQSQISMLLQLATANMDWADAVTGNMSNVWGKFYTGLLDNFKNLINQMINDLLTSGLLALLMSILGLPTGAGGAGIGLFAKDGALGGVFSAIFGGKSMSISPNSPNMNSNTGMLSRLDTLITIMSVNNGIGVNPMDIAISTQRANNMRIGY